MKASARSGRRFTILWTVGCMLAASLAAMPSAVASDADTDTHRQGTTVPAPADTPTPLAVGAIDDGGFEAGTPNPYWSEGSDTFGTPLCTITDCGGTGGGTGPNAGNWWAWFGGTVENESGWLYQSVVIPAGTASLSFYLEIPIAEAISRFELYVDSDSVFVATDSSQAQYATYTKVTVDLSAYADDNSHLVDFVFSKVAGGLSNFFLDDVTLSTGGSGTGTVEGIVRHAESPLAGVEVWLSGVSQNTCTAADGTFSFTGIPAGETLIAVTGPAVVLPCANADFVNASGKPLGVQAWDHKGVYEADEFSVAAGEVKFIDFDVLLRQPPMAVDDAASVANAGTVQIDVLANDSNPEGAASEIIKTSDPAHGTATLDVANWKFTYTHDGSDTTSDSFTYKLDDSVMESTPATVSISISALPTPPLPPLVAPTVGLQDPATGQWHLRDAAGKVTTFYFGNPGDNAFMGDWNCDGVDTPGLFRQSDAYAYLRNSNSQGIADIRFFFGNPSDIPLAGDFNGDGCDTLSIYRPSEQTFYIMNALGKNEGGLGAAEYSFGFGNPGDKPVVGDWDGDNVDEIGLHRESTGYFYYRNTLNTGIASDEFYFGDPGDRFIAGDWGVVDGKAAPAVFRPANTTFYFRHTMTEGNADSSFVWGLTGLMPVAGNFGDLPGGGGIPLPPPPPPPPGSWLPVDGTFSGPLQAQTGVSGDVIIEVLAGGTEVRDPRVHLTLDGFSCAGAIVDSDGTWTSKGTAPIIGGSFTVSGFLDWQWTFGSVTTASGTVSGEYELWFGGPSCTWGPISWTATAQ